MTGDDPQHNSPLHPWAWIGERVKQLDSDVRRAHQRIDDHERGHVTPDTLQRLEGRLDAIDTRDRATQSTLTRVETTMSNIDRTLEEMKRSMDAAAESRSERERLAAQVKAHADNWKWVGRVAGGVAVIVIGAAIVGLWAMGRG